MTSVAATQFLPVAGAATSANRSMIVSLHDIAPSTWNTGKQILTDLGRHGVRISSILVVPDYHHEGSINKNQGFVSWLRELESDGHEIVIHGYFHERPRQSQQSLYGRFVTQVYTEDEGEFFDLNYEEALRRITIARDDFRAVGLKPFGFIAPAWLLGNEAERAARDAGMEYTTRLGAVRDLRSGEDFPSRSLVYSVRNEWRRRTSLCWNAMLGQIAKQDWLLRLSIHPVDYSHPAVWGQICRFLDRMVPQRTVTTYQDWTSEWRMNGTSLL
jgi:predicted deacetylase